jgi:hypothetical protein
MHRAEGPLKTESSQHIRRAPLSPCHEVDRGAYAESHTRCHVVEVLSCEDLLFGRPHSKKQQIQPGLSDALDGVLTGLGVAFKAEHGF